MSDASDFLIKALSIDSTYYQKFQLCAALGEIVEYGWFIKNDEPQAQKIPDLHIADGHMEIVFVFEGAYTKNAVANQNDSRTITSSCVVGMQTKSHFVRGLGRLNMMGVKLTPLGFSLLFGKKVSSSKDANIYFDSFGEDWLRTLHDRMATIATLQDRVRALSGAILKQLSQRGVPEESLKISIACHKWIVANQGMITVQQLAALHNKSIRQVQRYFGQHFDISPKQFSNIIRFKHLYRESVLQKIPPTTYLMYGYFDQAHFIRDFHRHTGITPTQAIKDDFLEKNRIAEVNLV